MHKVAPQETAAERVVLTHVMLDMYGVNSETLNDPDQIGSILSGAAAAIELDFCLDSGLKWYIISTLPEIFGKPRNRL